MPAIVPKVWLVYTGGQPPRLCRAIVLFFAMDRFCMSDNRHLIAHPYNRSVERLCLVATNHLWLWENDKLSFSPLGI